MVRTLKNFLITIGGDAKTLMIAQVSPAEQSESESVSSLKFASRVGTVENGPAKQNINDNTISRLKEEVHLNT